MNKLNLPSMNKFGQIGLTNPFVLLWASPHWKRPPDIDLFYLNMEAARRIEPRKFMKSEEMLIVETHSVYDQLFYMPIYTTIIHTRKGTREEFEEAMNDIEFCDNAHVFGFDWVQAAVYENMTPVEQRMVCLGYQQYRQMVDKLRRVYVDDESIISLKMQEWFDNNWYVYKQMLTDLVYNNVRFSMYQRAFEIFMNQNPDCKVADFKRMIVKRGEDYDNIQFLCDTLYDIKFNMKIEDIEYIEQNLMAKWRFCEIELPSEEEEIQMKIEDQLEEMLMDDKIVEKSVKYVTAIEEMEDEFAEFQEMNERFRFYKMMVRSKPQNRKFVFEIEEERILMTFEVREMKRSFYYQSKMYLEEMKQCLRMVEALGIDKQCAAAFLLYVIVREKRKKKIVSKRFFEQFDLYISAIRMTGTIRELDTLEEMENDDVFEIELIHGDSEDE